LDINFKIIVQLIIYQRFMQKFNPILLQMNELRYKQNLVLWKIVLSISGCAQKLWGDKEYGIMDWDDLGYERMMPEWQVAYVDERARDGWIWGILDKSSCA
jgi:hypothetical protein